MILWLGHSWQCSAFTPRSVLLVELKGLSVVTEIKPRLLTCNDALSPLRYLSGLQKIILTLFSRTKTKNENSDKYSKNLELIIKVLMFISAWHQEWTGIFSKARLLRLLERTHSSFSLVLFSTTRLSTCLLRSSHSLNRNSPTVTSQCRPCNCFLTQ